MTGNTKATGMAVGSSGTLVIILSFLLNNVFKLNVPADVAVAAATFLAPFIHSLLEAKGTVTPFTQQEGQSGG